MPGMFGNLGQGMHSMFGGLSPYSNTLLMGGLGMLSGNNNQQGFQNALAGMQAGSEIDQGRRDRRKEAERLQALHAMLQSQSGPMAGMDPMTAQYLEQSPETANSVLADRLTPKRGNDAPSSVQEYTYAKAQGYKGTFEDWKKSERSSQPQFGVQPVWGTDEQGNPTAVQIGNSGNAQTVPWPKGFKPGPGFNKIDLGDSWGILDRTGQITQRVPKNLEKAATESAYGTAVGGSRGAAEAGIPAVRQAAEMMTGMIQDIRSDPHRASSTGIEAPLNRVPATAGYGFQKKSDQLRGQAFMQAFQSLKGAGAISEKEGQAATDAITRIDTATNDEDYVAALDDLQAIVSMAVKRMEEKAGQSADPNADPLGIR